MIVLTPNPTLNKMLADEYGTASNIQPRVNCPFGHHVDAPETVEILPNGLVIYCSENAAQVFCRPAGPRFARQLRAQAAELFSSEMFDLQHKVVVDVTGSTSCLPRRWPTPRKRRSLRSTFRRSRRTRAGYGMADRLVEDLDNVRCTLKTGLETPVDVLEEQPLLEEN